MRLILASTSVYRRELLARLRLPFESVAPNVDESQHAHERPAELSARLAREKALAVARERPDALVIGSDQVASLAGRALGKPGSHDRAVEQLRACSGGTVSFYTSVCVAGGGGHAIESMQDHTEVVFRALDEAAIGRYVRAESPLDCAGSFKCEGLGISLFESLRSDDPTALVGLPLIGLCRLLRRFGLDIP